MAKYSHRKTVSEQTKQESLAVARGTQKPGQTKEQTRLIAQGVQKGIEQYKKQQKAKMRERDKLSKKQVAAEVMPPADDISNVDRNARLPWILLVLSWLFFGIVFAFYGF